MSNLEIRRIQPSGMDQWFTMRIQSLRDSPSAFLASPETELAQGVEFFRARIAEGGNDNVIFGCFDGQDLVGALGIVREGQLKARHKAFIWGVYVRPHYRGKKIGNQLLQTALDFARNTMAVEQVNLSVDSSRIPAKTLYTNMGFKKWGTESRAVRVGEEYFDEDYMSVRF